MNLKNISRRKFLDYAKLSCAFLLTSCQSSVKKITLGFYQKFFPDAFISSIPKNWTQKNINLKNNLLEGDLQRNDLLLLNDGWLNRVKLNNFSNIETSLTDKLNNRSKTYLNLWDVYERKKLFPIGIIPYVLIIKNNKKLKINEQDPWDILLTKSLKGKIILPNSPRILISIAEKINSKKSLSNLLKQNIIFDDKNSIDWLINTDALIALMPLSQSMKFLKIDTRLSILFPDQGVPLMWNFLLINSQINQKEILKWLQILETKENMNKLNNEGWFLPFKNEVALVKHEKIPSEECWNNSWSFPPINKLEKDRLRNFWNSSF